MDRAAKSELVTSLNTVLKDTGLVVVAHYAGMTVAQMTDYRQRINEAGGKVKVAKNRLAKLALKDTLVRTDRRSLQGADLPRLFEGSDRGGEGLGQLRQGE